MIFDRVRLRNLTNILLSMSTLGEQYFVKSINGNIFTVSRSFSTFISRVGIFLNWLHSCGCGNMVTDSMMSSKDYLPISSVCYLFFSIILILLCPFPYVNKKHSGECFSLFFC
uniref:Uncharacterized protein n=1 Tax=Cacopsylla melanoneura TaxID=428564 RepID=A0A8D8S9E5_9HEMI